MIAQGRNWRSIIFSKTCCPRATRALDRPARLRRISVPTPDYYFNNNGGVPLLLPMHFVQGWAGCVTTGLAYNINNGPKLSVGGELGGLGNDFIASSLRGRASVPF